MNAERKRDEFVQEIVGMLVAGEYARLESLSKGVRLSAGTLENAVNEYGRKLKAFPSDALGEIEYVEIRDSIPTAWAVTVPLFTEEEGRSDLSLELTLIKVGPDKFELELDDILVL